jgi:transcriptional regulator with XRE-family HTH domain
MVRRAADAEANLALFNLREAAGQSQQDVAEALNRLAATKGKRVCLTANQISRWERGVSRPSPLYRQLLAEHFGVTVAQLGLARLRNHPNPAIEAVDVTLLDQVATPTITVDPAVAESQQRWRTIRRNLNARRVPLARATAKLYSSHHFHTTGLLIGDRWLPDRPIPLANITLTHDPHPPAPQVAGTDDATAATRPLAGPHRRYYRYSQAIRALDHPRLFENRHAWRLLNITWTNQGGHLTFGDTTYFDHIDLAEALAHEAADHLIDPNGHVTPATWRSLTARAAVGDPFDLGRRALGVSTNTLTIRRDRDGASMVLHQRSSGNVAVAGDMLHVMPCGVFQPSSIQPAALAADFDLWRNIQREYSEEFLGNPEHDGSGAPIDYSAPPFTVMDQAIADGRLQVYCLGVGLDALTLFGEILTVAVFDADLYDQLFADMVDINEEGAVVKTGRVHPTSAIPFTSHMVDELIDSGRLAPAAAAILMLAWRQRRAILDGGRA